MYQIIHFAAECYPIAKTGGLGDVVGALPKYLIKKGLNTAVFLPWYDQKWNHTHTVKHEWNGNLSGSHFNVNYEIIKSKKHSFHAENGIVTKYSAPLEYIYSLNTEIIPIKNN